MAVDLTTNLPVYPVDTYKSQRTKAEEAKTAEAEQTAATATAAAEPKADGFERPKFKAMDMNNINGPFKFVVAGKGADKMTHLSNLVSSMFGQQKNVAAVASYGNTANNMVFYIDQETQDAAKAAIADDGYWGAEQTATRLLDFAKALSGGDSSKIEELRDAVMKGYEAVADMFDGALPEVSLNTYDKVMQGFDDWAKEAAAALEPAETPEGGEEALPGATSVEE
jgi:hypothetical protein